MEFEKHPFFDQVGAEDTSGLAEIANREEYPSDTIIFEEGSSSEALYLVLEGEVAFCKRAEEGKYRVVGYSSAGAFFGEIGLFTDEPRALRAESRGRTVLASIPKDALIEFIKRVPGPLEIILKNIVKHLHETTRHYMDDMLQQEKMAVVGSMVNTIIHDFKNPFCLISLGAQIIMQSHSEEKTQKLCQNIEDQIQRMVGMFEELIEFSRGEQELKLETVDIRRMLERFRELNVLYFQDDKIAVDISVPDIEIDAEERKLLRVLQNLVGNAFDDEEGKITIAGELEGNDTLLLQVADNGNGIPEEIQDRFFEAFVTYGKSKGTGLGSAIVKSIVEAHGGSIEFETAEGVGTTFSIRLPIRQTP